MPVTPLRPGDPEQVGPHRLLGRLGQGGMGTVFLGVSPDERAVAVKVLREAFGDVDSRRRFRAELAALQRVRGPHLVEVLDADVDADTPYLVTRFVPGERLDALVARDGPLQPPVLHAVARGLADALTAVHAAGVVHRDVTPGNVLVLDGQPHLIDLGLAVAADVTAHTRTGVLLGTAGYLAPEQVVGEDATPAADLHAWGATVAFAGTGRPPYGTGRPEAVLYRIVHGDPDLDGLDRSLHALVAAAVARDPADRPTAEEVLDALGGPSTEQPVTVHLPRDVDADDATTVLAVPRGPDGSRGGRAGTTSPLTNAHAATRAVPGGLGAGAAGLGAAALGAAGLGAAGLGAGGLGAAASGAGGPGAAAGAPAAGAAASTATTVLPSLARAARGTTDEADLLRTTSLRPLPRDPSHGHDDHGDDGRWDGPADHRWDDDARDDDAWDDGDPDDDLHDHDHPDHGTWPDHSWDDDHRDDHPVPRPGELPAPRPGPARSLQALLITAAGLALVGAATLLAPAVGAAGAVLLLVCLRAVGRSAERLQSRRERRGGRRRDPLVIVLGSPWQLARAALDTLLSLPLLLLAAAPPAAAVWFLDPVLSGLERPETTAATAVVVALAVGLARRSHAPSRRFLRRTMVAATPGPVSAVVLLALLATAAVLLTALAEGGSPVWWPVEPLTG